MTTGFGIRVLNQNLRVALSVHVAKATTENEVEHNKFHVLKLYSVHGKFV